MTLTAHAARGKPSSESIYAWNVRICFLAQLATLLAALGFTVAFGIRAA
jgi:hypothetical protein